MYGDSIDAALGVALIAFVIGIINILSFIQIIGWAAALVLNWFYVIPKILEFVSIEHTWLITAIYSINAILGFLVTAVVAGVIIMAIMKR